MLYGLLGGRGGGSGGFRSRGSRSGGFSGGSFLRGGLGWRGGFGILWDDLVAAFCTLLVIALWRFFA